MKIFLIQFQKNIFIIIFMKWLKWIIEKNVFSDKIGRKTNGAEKLRKKPWSNFIFYFVNLNEYRNLFGNNSENNFHQDF